MDTNAEELMAKYRAYYNKSCLAMTVESIPPPSKRFSLSFKESPTQNSSWPRYPLNYPQSLVHLVRESSFDQGYAALEEGLITTYPFSAFSKWYRTWCEEHLSKDLLQVKITKFQKSAKDLPAYQAIRMAELDQKSDIAGLVSLFLPFSSGATKSTIDAQLSELVDYANLFGYDLAEHVVIPEVDGVFLVELVFEARYYKKDFELSSWLYHLTDQSNAAKIAKQGIVPRSEHATFAYQERAYLFCESSPLEMLRHIQAKEIHSNVHDFAVFRIKKESLEADPKYKSGKLAFYVDPKHVASSSRIPTAIYTLNTIPPSLLDDQVALFSVQSGVASSRTLASLADIRRKPAPRRSK